MPSITSRDNPAFWEQRIEECRRLNQRGLDAYRRYSAWYAGDMTELRDQLRNKFGIEDAIESNMTNLVTRSALAELMFRAPRFLVKPLGNPMTDPWLNKRAEHETMLLNDWVEDAHFFRTGRRTLTDMLLAPKGIIKVGYAKETWIDPVNVMRNREQASTAIKQMLLGRPYGVRREMMHPVWIEQLELAILRATDGTIPNVPVRFIEQIDAKIDKHKAFEAEARGRPTETIRRDRIFARRIPYNVFFADPYADEPSGREWVTEAFLARREDVMKDGKLDAMAREELGHRHNPALFDPDKVAREYHANEERVILFETVDLIEGTVRLHARGATRNLRKDDYHDIDIAPSGPYVEASFMEDPRTDQGVAPPSTYEAHQLGLTLLDSVIAETALRSIPRMAFDATQFDDTEVEAILDGKMPGRHIPLRNLMPGKGIKDVIGPVPTNEISDLTLQARAIQQGQIERLSGQGAAKLGGGDTANSATASAIIGESTSNLAEDRAAVMDDFFSRVGRLVLRHQRRYYTADRVAEVTYDDLAYKTWPAIWSKKAIRDDKGAAVVSGSSRRKNSAVDQKLTLDALGLLLQQPDLPPQARIELTQRALEGMGVTGIDFTGALLMQEQQQQGEGNAVGKRVERRGEESSEASHAAVHQGANNPGGGRAGPQRGSSVAARVGDARAEALRGATRG